MTLSVLSTWVMENKLSALRTEDDPTVVGVGGRSIDHVLSHLDLSTL